MAKKAENRSKIVAAAMRLAAERGWRGLSMAEIAEAAKVPLADVYAECGSKAGVAAAFTAMIDEKVLGSGAQFAPDDTARDRLFDVLMRRFDAMKPYRDGLAAIVRDRAAMPVANLCAGARLMNSMAWMLEAAEIGTGGLSGRVRAKGAAAVYLSVLPVWFRDDTEDQSRTMAALDRRLERAERAAGLLWRGRRTAEGEPPPQTPPPAGEASPSTA